MGFSDQVYALVDCNSFYCSCERLFRPELANKPIIVLSNNDGCVISRSAEAKEIGIKMGEPFFKIKNLCHSRQVAVFSSNFSLYTNISDRVMNVLKKYGRDIEVYSVDEAWLDISGLTEDYYDYGMFIKDMILKEVGIPVGVGIAPTKTMAKLANHLAKKSKKSKGVVDLSTDKFWDIALKRVSIADVWGIGRKSVTKLNELGIKTAYDFAYYENDVQILKLLTKTGVQRKQELLGQACFVLEKEIQRKQVIRSSRSFGENVYEKAVLREAIANFVTAACRKLRKQKSVCGAISIFIRTSPFKNTVQYSAYDAYELSFFTANTCTLIEFAWGLLDRIYRPGICYKKAGIELHKIRDNSEFQLSLFENNEQEKSFKLMRTLDFITDREGEFSIKSMACGVNSVAWKMLRDYKSPRYTTSWNELPTICIDKE